MYTFCVVLELRTTKYSINRIVIWSCVNVLFNAITTLQLNSRHAYYTGGQLSSSGGTCGEHLTLCYADMSVYCSSGTTHDTNQNIPNVYNGVGKRALKNKVSKCEFSFMSTSSHVTYNSSLQLRSNVMHTVQ